MIIGRPANCASETCFPSRSVTVNRCTGPSSLGAIGAAGAAAGLAAGAGELSEEVGGTVVPSQPARTMQRSPTHARVIWEQYPTVPLPRSNPVPLDPSLRWVVAIDTGGTFTDVVARGPNGQISRVKVPSDGSISATVVSCARGSLRIAPAAGLTLPDGFLDGWMLSAPVAGTGNALLVRTQRGTTVELDDAVELAEGTPLRFMQRQRGGADWIDAPRIGLHIVTATPLSEALAPIELRLSTTRGTNALLEGRGAKVGVLVSDGLTGVVEIGDQTRENLFARVPVRTGALAHAVRAIGERTLASGQAHMRADNAQLHAAADALRAEGCDCIVVSLAHALLNEREAQITAELDTPSMRVIAAAAVAPHARLLTRTETACVHARIAPILSQFVVDATRGSSEPFSHAPEPFSHAPESRAFIFTSAGVLQSAATFAARDTLFSGPAGGACAVAGVARRHAIARAVGFDMGGTSSDVTRTCDGSVALRSESRIARATVAAPSVAIDSVAAGGGSICRVRDGAFEVGPESAGSDPGPACYGRGGPLTISDVNLLAGHFAPGFESMSLDRAAAERALNSAIDEHGCTRAAAISAFLDIANARMALAIETLCIRDGVDPRGHSLIAFGGAGGQHACAIATRLGLDRIVFPRFAGFMCAQGVFDAEPARFETTPVLLPLRGIGARLNEIHALTAMRARQALSADGFTDAADGETSVALRLSGQESTIEVDFGDEATLESQFRARFLELFGYAPPARAIEVVSLRTRAIASRVHARTQDAASETPAVEDDARLGSTANPRRDPIPRRDPNPRRDSPLHRDALHSGTVIDGPALIVDIGETVVLEAGWCAIVHQSGDLVATRTSAIAARSSNAEQELFSARLESIALSMGHVLERTALSPNIRDRLDFSCAVLDRDGALVQNAPHLPVHLGALGVCVRSVAAVLELAEGDIAVTNHPAFGGSHLPDVTTVAPVFVGGLRVGYVAVRAHHAEIGGTRPGSFPPDARVLAEEGVVLAPFLAMRAGSFDLAGCRARFADAPFPSRNPDENIADLLAQIAATRHGVTQMQALATELGAAFPARCAGELDRADRALRAKLRSWPEREVHAQRQLDDGSVIRVRVERVDDRLQIDFSGSAPVHRGNFNAPRAVTQAATLYALRLFIDRDVPMNEGLLRAVDLIVPEGMLNPSFSADPTCCPPVVAGNVETSQSVVATLIEAFAIAAESQSTMNNVLFGDATFGVYETLGGGAGAGLGLDGASAVHVHMSNTRLTDVDVLERRAPVVIRRFEMRPHSGGNGAQHGGNGLIRSYQFLRPVSLSFFGSRRKFAPQGLDGGQPGACATQQAVIGGIAIDCSDAVLALELGIGDQFTVQTPGGGGFGRARFPD